MGWARFGTARDYDDLPIEDWMDGRNDEVAQRQAYEDAGYDAWASSTGTGTNLQAAQPSDVVALGGSSLGAAAAGANDDPALGGQVRGGQVRGGQGPTSPAPRYVRARPGDSISSLLGTSSPGAIGRFAALNGMDGGSSTIYSGRVYALPTDGTTISADETAAGSQLLARDNARAAALRARNIANDQLTARLLAGKNVWTGEPTYAGPVPVRSDLGSVASLATRPSWYDNPAIKVPAGAAAFTGGLLYGGLVRGPVRTGQFIGDALDFGARLRDPRDAENHPLDVPARQQVKDFARGAVAMGQWAASDPSGAASLIPREFHELRIAHDPTSIPIAPTTSEEMDNQFEVGANDGEFLTPGTLFNRGRAAVEVMQGGEEAVKAARYAAKVKPAEYARLRARGDSPAMADYLSDPYPRTGMGSHFVARSAKFPNKVLGIPLPESIAGQPLPRGFIESRFNVFKPEGVSRDQLYTDHFGYDGDFYGAFMPPRVNGGKGWRGRELGVRRYGPVERLVKGAPAPLKTAVGGAAAVGGLTGYNLFGGDRP